jgi:hypothetical protein
MSSSDLIASNPIRHRPAPPERAPEIFQEAADAHRDASRL